MSSLDDSLKKGGSIDIPLRHPHVYNRSELESSSIMHNQSAVTDQITSGSHLIKSQPEKNLFYKVQDSTLNQDQTDHEIEYLDEHELLRSNNNNLNRPIYGPDGRVGSRGDGVDSADEDEDDDYDGMPITADIEDHHVIFSKPCSPTNQADDTSELEGTVMEDLETYAVEHRNADHSPFDLNALAGQRTELYDRKNAKLFKKKLERGLHVKSLLNPSSNQSEIDTLIYNARSGVPNQNFNFAKNTQH